MLGEIICGTTFCCGYVIGRYIAYKIDKHILRPEKLKYSDFKLFDKKLGISLMTPNDFTIKYL